MNNTKRDRERSKCERAYLAVRPTIFGVCAGFARKYGGDIEDLVSQAHYHFMMIYYTHDPARGSFEADVQYRLHKRLLETHETESNRKRILNAVPATEENISVSSPAYFDFGLFMEGLSEEAAEIVRLVFNPQPDVDLAIVERGGPTPHNMRGAIREYLSDMQWTVQQIRGSFREIREALTGE